MKAESDLSVYAHAMCDLFHKGIQLLGVCFIALVCVCMLLVTVRALKGDK